MNLTGYLAVWGMASLLLTVTAAPAQSINGSVLEPTPANLALTWSNASVSLPRGIASEAAWQGRLAEMPMPMPASGARSPLVVLMHGSSGNAAFIKEYQAWLAQELGLPSIAPDSMAIPDRLTYTSPIDKPTYERVHALRLAELRNALARAASLPWVDPRRIVVIGTSEGAVPVARLDDRQPLARVIYAWSCEQNYFVEEPRTAIPRDVPVLAMIAVKDPFFSPENAWSKDVKVSGTCAQALKEHASAMVVTLATDKHTIVNFPEARDVTAGFLRRVLSEGAGRH